MHQGSFEEKMALVYDAAHQAKMAAMTLPTWGNCIVDDKTAVMDQVYFDELLEYSSTLPTGTFIGKRWKRNNNGNRPHVQCSKCQKKYTGWGDVCPDSCCLGNLVKLEVEPDWCMGEYVKDSDPKLVGIVWRKILVV